LPAFGRAADAQNERPIAAKEIGQHAFLATLERQRADAILRRDVALLRSLMARQYYHVDSRGRMRSKTELLTALERDDFRFRIYEIESTEVQILQGGASALVTGTFRTVQAGASARPFRGRFAHLWVRQPDGWKNTFHQSTEIRPAQDDCACN
jgi:hypothetical protein